MKLRFLFLVPALCMVLPGCIYVRDTHYRRREPECRPSEYWDGYQCRHKGQGHGARKHDHDAD